MIAFIGAMEIEVEALQKRMTEVCVSEISKIKFIEGKLANQPVVVMQSGIGKTASALSTTVLLEHYDVEGVVNIGTAGGLKENQEVLDVVVSTKVAHHDVEVADWPTGFNQDKTCYSGDSRYIDILQQIMEEHHDRVWLGPIASGDQFVCTENQVERILARFPESYCAEMEGASIAQVCRHYEKPFVIVRSLSDITLREGNEMTFDEYAEKASERSAQWCEKFMERI